MKLITVIMFTFATMAWADDDFTSAYREPDISYEMYIRKIITEKEETNQNKSSPLREAELFGNAKLPKATSWTASELHTRFEQMRDSRFLVRDESDQFPRRISWLFPDDGCFARAALANRNLFRWFYPVPSKVFAFGNLKVVTKNSPKGYVTWWYHVAPIVEVAGEKFILDPAIEPTRPLELTEWLSRMGKPKKIELAICNSGTYSPRDSCFKETDGLEKRAESTQFHYLSQEEMRLERLGRETELELGDNPPWK